MCAADPIAPAVATVPLQGAADHRRRPFTGGSIGKPGDFGDADVVQGRVAQSPQPSVGVERGLAVPSRKVDAG
jgi:hypothetical protein